MALERERLSEAPVTHIACVWLLTGVCCHVVVEVVGQREPALTDAAPVRLDAGVRARMPIEVVRLQELLATVGAKVWCNTGVCNHVPPERECLRKTALADCTWVVLDASVC